jgi:hypothetical protein
MPHDSLTDLNAALDKLRLTQPDRDRACLALARGERIADFILWVLDLPGAIRKAYIDGNRFPHPTHE